MRRLNGLFMLAVAAWLLLAGGCGYFPVGGGDGFLAGRPVNVAIFANRTTRPRLEIVLAKSLRWEVARLSPASLVSEERAELILGGAVTSVAITQISYSASDRVKEYRLTLQAEATLTERRSGKVVWKGTETGQAEYPVSQDLALQLNAEEAALKLASERLSERLVRHLLENF